MNDYALCASKGAVGQSFDCLRSSDLNNSDLALATTLEVWRQSEQRDIAAAPKDSWAVGFHLGQSFNWGKLKQEYVLGGKDKDEADKEAASAAAILDQKGNVFKETLKDIEKAIHDTNTLAVDKIVNNVFGTETKRSIGRDAEGNWNLKVSIAKDNQSNELTFPISGGLDFFAFQATNNSELGLHAGFPVPAPPGIKIDGEASISPFSRLSDLTQFESLQHQAASKSAEVAKWLSQHPEVWTKGGLKTCEEIKSKFGNDFTCTLGFNADNKPSIILKWGQNPYQAEVEISPEIPDEPTKKESESGPAELLLVHDDHNNPQGPKPTLHKEGFFETAVDDVVGFVKEHPIVTLAGVAALALAASRFRFLKAVKLPNSEIVRDTVNLAKTEETGYQVVRTAEEMGEAGTNAVKPIVPEAQGGAGSVVEHNFPNTGLRREVTNPTIRTNENVEVAHGSGVNVGDNIGSTGIGSPEEIANRSISKLLDRFRNKEISVEEFSQEFLNLTRNWFRPPQE